MHVRSEVVCDQGAKVTPTPLSSRLADGPAVPDQDPGSGAFLACAAGCAPITWGRRIRRMGRLASTECFSEALFLGFPVHSVCPQNPTVRHDPEGIVEKE